MQAWQYADLGEFVYIDHSWGRRFSLPAFSRLKYRGFFEPADGTLNAGVPLAVLVEDEFCPPHPLAISLAREIVANQSRLLDLSLNALLRDIRGVGPKSCSGWFGQRDFVRKLIPGADLTSDLTELNLCDALGIPSILIKNTVDKEPRLTATLAFHCIFEPEHGLGFLTDGEGILGIGSALDVEPFH